MENRLGWQDVRCCSVSERGISRSGFAKGLKMNTTSGKVPGSLAWLASGADPVPICSGAIIRDGDALKGMEMCGTAVASGVLASGFCWDVEALLHYYQ
jgi:hypothetical protein